MNKIAGLMGAVALALPLADCNETGGASASADQATVHASPSVTDESVHAGETPRRGISEEGGMKASGPSQGKGGESR